MTALTRVALVATASLALLAGCSAAPAAAPAAPATTPTATRAATPTAAAAVPAAVDVVGFKFVPATLEVAKGTKVTWTNKDTAKHTVTSGTDAVKDGKFDGPLDAAPGTFSFTFTDAGTYPYFCTFHKSMIASVTVK